MQTAIILLSILFSVNGAGSAEKHNVEKSTLSDSVFFDGYYLILYTKEQIRGLQKNKERKRHGKSYQVSFESSNFRFFVSKDSLSQNTFAAIVDDLPKRNKNEVFIECDKDYGEALDSAFNNRVDHLSSCTWPQLKGTNKYFTSGKRSRYCFKIYEMSGWFKRFRINTENKRDAIGKKIVYIRPGLNEFYAYFFTSFRSYSAYTNSLGDKVHLWKVVSPIFE